MADALLELGSLFASAFISSTVAPGGSEVLLAWMLANSQIAPGWLWASATLGNTLGALTTWGLGWLASKGWPLNPKLKSSSSQRALSWLRRYGMFALLFSWLPVVGDGLCLAAGWLKMRMLPGMALIALGKGLRYGVLVWWFG